MGAHNFAAMLQTYRRALRDHDKAFRLLTYMAHVSRDDDPEPWFGMGHAALAYHALGRDLDERGEASQADLRAVRRGITTLLNIGAITVIRPANGRRSEHKTVCYRLHLHAPAKADDDRTDDEPQASNPPDDRRTLSGPTVGRSVVHRRTLSGSPQDAQRPPKEKEENDERGEEEVVTSQGDLTTRAHTSERTNEIHPEEADEAGDAVACAGLAVSRSGGDRNVGELVDMHRWAQRRANDNGEFRPRSSAEARRRAREVLAAALAAKKGLSSP